MGDKCEHFSRENFEVIPKTQGCEECEKEHLPAVALRLCLICGHVGCCDSSVGKHATEHYKKSGHPIMKAMHENPWIWCYIHQEYY